MSTASRLIDSFLPFTSDFRPQRLKKIENVTTTLSSVIRHPNETKRNRFIHFLKESQCQKMSRLLISSASRSLPSFRYFRSNLLSSKYPHLRSQNLFKSTAAAIIDKPHESESFLTGASSLYAEQMYENWCEDPNSVHETWRKYFQDMEGGIAYNESNFNRPTVVVSNQKKSVDASTSHLAVSNILQYLDDITGSGSEPVMHSSIPILFVFYSSL